jgi:hypothetical protein
MLGLVLMVLMSAALFPGVSVSENCRVSFETEVVYYPLDEGIVATQPESKVYNVSIYDKDLTLKRRFQWRRGEGPGDVKIVKGIVAEGDKIYVWDDGLRRMNVFTRDWKFVEFKKIPSMKRALLLHRWQNMDVFEWGDFTAKNGKQLMVDCIGVWDGTAKHIVASATGPWVVKGKYNDSRDHMVSCFVDGNFYTTTNTAYDISVFKAGGTDFTKTGQLRREVKTADWSKKCEDLMMQLLPQTFKAEFPDKVPPVFEILANDKCVAVLTNEAILQYKTTIDVWQKGDYKGSVKIPIIFSQRFIFPSAMHIPSGVYLRGDTLWALHYNEEDDAFNIVKRTIKF